MPLTHATSCRPRSATKAGVARTNATLPVTGAVVIVGVSGRQQCPHMMTISKCDNFTLYRIKLRNSPHMFVTYKDGDGFTAWGVRIWAPGEGARSQAIQYPASP